MGDTQPVYCRAYQRHDDSGPRALHADAPAGNGLSATLRNCPAKLSAAPDLRRPQQRKQPVCHARIAPRHAHHGDGTPSAAGTVTSERYAYDFVTGVEAEAPSWDLADTACQGSLNSFGCSIANSTSTSRPWARRPHWPKGGLNEPPLESCVFLTARYRWVIGHVLKLPREAQNVTASPSPNFGIRASGLEPLIRCHF